MANKKLVVKTCYGCKEYYNSAGEVGYPFSTKHCGQDHWECPYFLGEGEPLGKKVKESEE